MDPRLDLDGPQLDFAARHPHMLRFEIGIGANSWAPSGFYWTPPQQLWPYVTSPVYAFDVDGTVALPSGGPPSKGVWQANQVVLAALNNTSVGARGWRCVRGGKPGEWEPFKTDDRATAPEIDQSGTPLSYPASYPASRLASRTGQPRARTDDVELVDCPLNPSANHGANASAAHCALFCNGTCPYHPDWSPMKPENLTVYRITPYNVTGLSQKDTGDAGGDAGFYAGMMLVHLAECQPPYTSSGCFLAASPPVITKYLLETDGEYGPYLKCNPRVHTDPDGHVLWQDTSKFDCTYGNNGRIGGCSCARANRTVGMDPVMHNMNCTKPDASGKIPHGCQGVGWWYSTTAEGECKDDALPGDGSCSWRTAATIKTINATCLRNHIVGFMAQSNPSCWANCSGGKTNYTSPCFRHCYESARSLGVSAARMTGTWDAAFDQVDPAKGGCPAITVHRVPPSSTVISAKTDDTINGNDDSDDDSEGRSSKTKPRTGLQCPSGTNQVAGPFSLSVNETNHLHTAASLAWIACEDLAAPDGALVMVSSRGDVEWFSKGYAAYVPHPEAWYYDDLNVSYVSTSLFACTPLSS